MPELVGKFRSWVRLMFILVVAIELFVFTLVGKLRGWVRLISILAESQLSCAPKKEVACTRLFICFTGGRFLWGTWPGRRVPGRGGGGGGGGVGADRNSGRVGEGGMRGR